MSTQTHVGNEFRPKAVVCTDAIGLLDPFVPDQRDERVAPNRHRSLPGRIRFSPPRRNGLAQVILTSLPLLIGDLLAILGCYSFVTLILSTLANNRVYPDAGIDQLGVAVIYVGIGVLMGLFPASGISPVLELRQIVLSCILSTCIVFEMKVLLGTVALTDIAIAVLGGLSASLMTPLVRASVRHHFSKVSWWGEAVVVIGSGVQGVAIYNYYRTTPQRGLRPIGIVDSSEERSLQTQPLVDECMPYLGSIRKLPRLTRRHCVRWGIVAPGGCGDFKINEVLRYAGSLPHLIVLQSELQLPSLWAVQRECAGVTGIHIRDHLRSPFSLAVKKLLSLFLAIGGLIAAAPFFVIAAVLIKRQSPGPVFYGHKRIGKGGKEFKAWKFRTMVANADQVLEQHLEADPEMRRQWFEDQKLKQDPRIIPGIGQLLRKTSLDEIPQLWNILKGEMSVVGPRPIVTDEIVRYREMLPLYLRVRPGLTGLWQISGRNDTSYDERVRLDSYYVCNWSIWLDLFIIVRTIRTMLLREGAY